MKVSLLFLVFVGFVAFFTAPAQSDLFSAKLNGSLVPNMTFSRSVGQAPPRPTGVANLTVTSAYSVEVCVQEAVQLLGDLSSCNPGGYFIFARGNSSTQSNYFSLDEDSIGSLFGGDFESEFVGDAVETNTVNLTLRGGSQYYLSVRYVGGNFSNTSMTSYIALFSYDATGCSDPLKVGLPDGDCVDSPPAPLGTTVQNSVGGNSNQYWQFTLPEAANQLVQATLQIVDNVVATSPMADASQVSLALRRGAAPADGASDASSSNGTNGMYTVSLPTPAPNALYYLEVANLGSNPQIYNLTITWSGCPAGFVGAECNSTFVDLTGNTTVVMYTGSGEYQYFMVRNQTLVIGVGTEDLDVVAPVLLASLWNYPSNDTALLASSDNVVDYISANNSNPNDNSTTWYVTVWANEGQEYYLWANDFCPYNCAGSKGGNETRGVCNTGTGVCNCNKGNGGLFCNSKGLALVWIIIIIIVCVIILAIAIGVPVACFLRNRRRARYERV